MDSPSPTPTPVTPELAALMARLDESERRARMAESELSLSKMRIVQLEERLRLLRIAKYGPRSESLSAAQLALFEQEISATLDEVAAEAMGVNTTRVKVRAFVIGAFWAGVAGGLYAHQYGYLSPTNFNFMKSFDPVVIIVLGGLGSVSGAILAAIGISLLPELLRPLQAITGYDFRMIFYSLDRKSTRLNSSHT